MKPKTYHDGAREERAAILRKIKRMLRGMEFKNPPAPAKMRELYYWIEERKSRYSKRKGGL